VRFEVDVDVEVEVEVVGEVRMFKDLAKLSKLRLCQINKELEVSSC
jgi:hypothetical protein